MLSFREKTIEFEPPEDVIERVKTQLEDIQPSLVITHYPNYGVHPDHNALGEATIEAVRRMDQANRPTVWAAAITNNFEEVIGEPDVIIPVEESLSFKIDAILKHKSQAGGMLEKLKNYTIHQKVWKNILKVLRKDLEKNAFSFGIMIRLNNFNEREIYVKMTRALVFRRSVL